MSGAVTGSFGLPQQQRVVNEAKDESRPWLLVLSISVNGRLVPLVTGLGEKELLRYYQDWRKKSGYTGTTVLSSIVFAEPL